MDIEAENEIKCLYIDVVLKNDILYVITGTDQETVNILQISANDFELINAETIRKHEFSVWACAVCPQNPEFNYLSGGDDCHLKLLDLRMPNKIGMVNKQSHIQGITTINFSPHDANVFATGSYDEHLRMFDIRKINQELLDYKRAGGVWRARFDLNDKNKILCGIYSENYFELIDYSDPNQCKLHKKQLNFQLYIFTQCYQIQNIPIIYQGNIVQTFKDHEKLAYSCDISLDSQYISTCSFYDKKLNLWKIQKE
ncbi:WD40-repeat-containing domain [Pseudocohnilembus persalinus]|uniref:methylated diphthine methylhydrolase n=1 Tax=Pseudocohnilembus persalinus TaxID=266149 RepID=A0A0V0QYI7_PSEPJ|nr:WD40-repeat-containing domain [Pseudocohnilembus persalinus]|eukprot:KRX07323.1 WD40-repeat-containing domain [Pseudocohnilembus persalinus]